MLQLVLLQPVDAVHAKYQNLVRLGVVVDDFGLHQVGRDTDILEQLSGATRLMHAELEKVFLPVARRKSRVVASSESLRAQLVQRLVRFEVQGARNERNLGIDFAAGKVRFKATRHERRGPARARACNLAF